jgi:hypothetical protein
MKRMITALLLISIAGFSVTVSSCSDDREIKTEIHSDTDRNLDGSVDTTIKRETKID